jgi:replicative DNA helicase
MEKNKRYVRSSEKQNKLLSRDISESLGKLPPQALDLEEAVLGALMLEKDALTKVLGMLRPEDFYSEAHNEIFQAIIDLFKGSEPVDMRTVVNQLRKTAKIDMVGGAYYIAELTSKVSSGANVEYHGRVIAEMAIKRKLIEIASQIHHDAYEDTTDVFELMDKTQGSMDEINGHYVRKREQSAKQVFQEVIDIMVHAMKHGALVGVPSGYTTLDRITGGWRKPDLIIVAARPSMGKTAFVGCIAKNLGVRFKKPVAIFSLEMSSQQLMQRMISCETGIELDKIIKGTLEEHEWTALVHKTNELSRAPIYIDDTPALTILELRAKCRRMKAEHGIELVVVDYLQLMRGDNSGNREQEIASISRALKAIAKELDIPVIALSQLSRAVETRGGDKRPQLSDLRESGSIEADADIVAFLYRAEYYKITVYEDGMPTAGTMEVIIAKNRNGACDTVMLKFIGKYSMVTDFDYQAPKYENPFSGMITRSEDVKSFKNFQVSRQEHDGEPEPEPEVLKKTDDTPF